jgi:hypothetical protein
MPSDGLITFWPRRWRVFVLTFVTGLALFAAGIAIAYAVHPWPGVWGGGLASACASVAVLAGLQTWMAPNVYAISVSDTEILGWPALRRSHIVPLADLDRGLSARRSPIDRILGQQHLYSTSGARIYVWRVVFAASDVRKLLDLLQLQERRGAPYA